MGMLHVLTDSFIYHLLTIYDDQYHVCMDRYVGPIYPPPHLPKFTLSLTNVVIAKSAFFIFREHVIMFQSYDVNIIEGGFSYKITQNMLIFPIAALCLE